MFLPEQDRYSLTRQQIHSQLASLYGGRVAEELIFGKDAVTTGASNDIERASQLARNMVTKWGLSETMGPLAYGENEDEVFLGRSVTQHKHISDETHRELDAEVRKIIDKAYRTTTEILENNRDKLDLMADALMKYETIDVKQINQIMDGNVPDPPDNWTEGGGRSGSGNKPTEAKGQTSRDEDDDEAPSGEPAPG
jgi:cell division protease FtsH